MIPFILWQCAALNVDLSKEYFAVASTRKAAQEQALQACELDAQESGVCFEDGCRAQGQ